MPAYDRKPQPLPRRDRALDTSTGRVGEVMDTIDTSHGRRVYLRPVGGGREWSTDEADVQLVTREQAA